MSKLLLTAADPVADLFNMSQFFTMQVGVTRLLLTLFGAFLAGLFIFYIYKRTFGGVMYSRNLNVSFVLLTLVTALVLMLVNNNLTLSLGMVGALSIIRFRTAVKDPIDTVFMFWAVGEGIAIGTAYFIEALVAAVVIGIVMIIMSVFKHKAASSYLLIIHYDEQASEPVKQLMKRLPKCRLKSKSVTPNGAEVTLEVRLKDTELGFIDKLTRVDGIYDALLVTHQGDIVA